MDSVRDHEGSWIRGGANHSAFKHDQGDPRRTCWLRNKGTSHKWLDHLNTTGSRMKIIDHLDRWQPDLDLKRFAMPRRQKEHCCLRTPRPLRDMDVNFMGKDMATDARS